MARIRHLEIQNFRGIQEVEWYPSPGLNCLIGPGDSGKSSILDAIDLCLGSRRSIQFTDADFYCLNVETPIRIRATIGGLEEGLKNLETYGMYLRGFDSEAHEIDDEPEAEAETVLTLQLLVGSDLEPVWSLFSDRAEAQGLARDVGWGDRARLAPSRIGAVSGYHLGWRRGSVLNRLSEERADAPAALARAARAARESFGDGAQDQLGQTLEIVSATAQDLGIEIGEHLRATLDAHSVSFGGGAIALHDENGVPLHALGSGSTRLLIAGLQRRAAATSSIAIVDEIEFGLEPHRIFRFLDSLGAKEEDPPLQVFMSTHSPVAVRELSAPQLFVVRCGAGGHEIIPIGAADDLQGTIRRYPEAFLARSVIVCEGATEIGFIRGIDQYRVDDGGSSIWASGVSLVDCGGGHADKPFLRASAFQSLGYRVAIVRDSDVAPSEGIERAFEESGGKLIAWRDARALEDELFESLPDWAVGLLVGRATEEWGEDLVDQQIRSASQGRFRLADVVEALRLEEFPEELRDTLGLAARSKNSSWFKSVSRMESAAREIVGPALTDVDEGFRALVDQLFAWAGDVSG